MPVPHQHIAGILFDSGDTLVRPREGEWFPGAHFREILRQSGATDVSENRLEQALKKGMTYLDTNHHVQTEEEERLQFERYYEILLEEVGISSAGTALPRELARSRVAELDIEPFPETHRVLKALHEQGFLLGVVSNAWPSLERKYNGLGLRHYLGPFVISAQVGCCKPEEGIYRTAIRVLGLPPEKVLFVDDDPDYVTKAMELGLYGLVIVRHGPPPPAPLQRIRSLEEVQRFLWRHIGSRM